MGACRHGQEGALAPSGNVVVCCALVFTSKRSVNELFMHYFHNLSSSSGSNASRPHRDCIPGPAGGTFVPRPLIYPPLDKNPAGAHGIHILAGDVQKADITDAIKKVFYTVWML